MQAMRVTRKWAVDIGITQVLAVSNQGIWIANALVIVVAVTNTRICAERSSKRARLEDAKSD